MPRVLAAALAALMAGGYFWLRAGADPGGPRAETVRVRRQTLDRTISATGVIRPVVGAEIEVGSRVSGIVRSLPVRVGDPVNRGDVMALLDPTEFQAEVDQARADLALARAELKLAESVQQRAASLAADGIVSPNELEAAAGDLEAARARAAREEARLRSAVIRLGYTEIRAPIRGVIADVTTREGETVAASFAAPTFVTIVDVDRLEVQAYVDETDIGRVFTGLRGTFTVDTYPGEEFTARVKAVDPKAAIQNGVVNYIVRLAFDGREGFVLRPEMTAHVRLQVEQRADVLTVPRRAIRRESGREMVRVRRGPLWEDQAVATGWRTDGDVEIRDGLKEGETVELNLE